MRMRLLVGVGAALFIVGLTGGVGDWRDVGWCWGQGDEPNCYDGNPDEEDVKTPPPLEDTAADKAVQQYLLRFLRDRH